MAEGGRPDHWGLQGMRERAGRIGSRFTLISSPGGGAVNVVSWTWDFGDGTPPQTTVTATTTHTYLASGNYIITLTVTDNLGKQGSLQKLLVVQ